MGVVKGLYEVAKQRKEKKQEPLTESSRERSTRRSKHTDSSKDRNTACGLNVRRRLQCARLYNFKCYSNSSSTEQPKTFAIATIDCASAF